MRKGFTLIELLAVIVILAVITLIATPLIMGVIDDAKKGAFKDSAYGIIKAAEFKYAQSMLKGNNEEMVVSYTDGNEDPSSSTKFEYKGTKPKHGAVVINKEGKVAMAIHDGKYCAEKGFDDAEVTISEKDKEACRLTGVVAFDFAVDNFGGSAGDEFYSIKPIENGYIVVGNSGSTDGDLYNMNQGYLDAVIVKYDANGNITWNKSFGGSRNDYFYDVTVVPSGYIAVGGSTSTDGDMTGLGKGGYYDENAIIVKYDANGNVVWKNSYGGTNSEIFRGVTAVSDGYIVVGESNSTDVDLAGLNKGEQDAIVVKYDLNGNVVWNKNFGGSKSEQFQKVIAINDGFVVVGQSTSDDKDLTGIHRGDTYDTDAIIVKYDTNGNVVWKKNFGGTDSDVFTDISGASDGYIVVGYTESDDYDLEGLFKGTYYDYDAIIVKYDLNGNVVWKKDYGGINYDYFRGVVAVSDGYMAVGNSESTDGDLTGMNKGYVDAIIVKYDLNGNIVWKKNFGGSSHEYFYGIIRTSNGYMIVGESISEDGDLEGIDKLGMGQMYNYEAIILKLLEKV